MMEKSDNTVNYHIDKSVVLFFIITILVTASVFAYRFVNYAPCAIVTFDYTASNLRVGEMIRFKDETKGANKREWDFGDSTKVDTRVSPNHTYKKPGLYFVKLRVNGRCETIEKLTIKKKAFILDSSRIAKFDIPVKIEVGKTLEVVDKTKGATSWEWRFGETGSVDDTTKNPEYVYNTPGDKTILLIVNGDPRYGTKKRITVFRKEVDIPSRDRDRDRDVVIQQPPIDIIPMKPPEEEDTIIPVDPPEDTRKDAPNISDKNFKNLIVLVGAKKASVNDFKDYLCDNLKLPITVNNKPTTFSKFCDKIRGRGIKVKQLEVKRGAYNCVTSIKVKYSKISLF